MAFHFKGVGSFHLFGSIFPPSLCKGKVFVTASFFIEKLQEDKTTQAINLYTSLVFYSDTIMDLLNCSQAGRAILDYYQASGEPQAVQEAIKTSQDQARKTFTLERMKNENTELVNQCNKDVHYANNEKKKM